MAENNSSAPLKTAEGAATLWCVHVTGADDVHPMPSREVALEEANGLNISFCRIKRQDVDPVLIAVVAEWPHSADSHAAGLMIRDECLRMRGGQVAVAVEAQAAPAAVAVSDEREMVIQNVMKLVANWGITGHSADFEVMFKAWVAIETALRAALAATPALPATEDSSAGDLARTLPDGWVPCTITYEGQYPEDVAYGPTNMMARLKKWLERYFALKAEVQAEPVSSDPVAWHSKLYGTCWMHKQPYHLDAGTHFFVRGNPNPVATVLSGAAIQWHTGTAAFEHGTFFYTAPQAQPADALDGAGQES